MGGEQHDLGVLDRGALGPIRRAYLLGLNCDVFPAGADEAGIPTAELQPLIDLLGGTGVCAKP